MGEKPMLVMHKGQINKTTTLCLPTEAYWSQATAQGHDPKYIKIILSGPQETPINPKELRNKWGVKIFQKGHTGL